MFSTTALWVNEYRHVRVRKHFQGFCRRHVVNDWQWNVNGKTASALPDHLASSRCGRLPPGWRPRLASAAGGNPAAGYRLPPAGGQRSWLFSPSPPPPSHNPSTWSPEDAAAPSSPLWRETKWKDVRTTCNHSCDRSVSVCDLHVLINLIIKQ